MKIALVALKLLLPPNPHLLLKRHQKSDLNAQFLQCLLPHQGLRHQCRAVSKVKKLIWVLMNQQDLESKIVESVELLKNVFEDISFNLAQVLAEQEMLQPNQLMSKNSYIERFQLQIAKELALSQERLKLGPKVLLQALVEMSEDNTISQDLMQELYKLLELASVIANERERFTSQLSEGKTIQAIAGLTDSSIERLYQAAKYVFDQKCFLDAANAFGFLTMLNASKFAFWLGLGNSEYKLNNYEQALFAYAFACRINPEDYLSHIFSCRCYEALGERDNAINALELALYVLGDNPDKKELKHNLEMQVKRLESM